MVEGLRWMAHAEHPGELLRKGKAEVFVQMQPLLGARSAGWLLLFWQLGLGLVFFSLGQAKPSPVAASPTELQHCRAIEQSLYLGDLMSSSGSTRMDTNPS